MRKPLIAGNWKMHKTPEEGVALVRALREAISSRTAEVAVAPSFVALSALADALEGSDVRLAAQNCHWETSGAFTGEVSAEMLEAVGCTYVIVGHSERRQLFNETDETVNRRARAVLANAMNPIVCVGETLAERDSGKTLDVVTQQLVGCLKDIPHAEAPRVVIAYEPVWAIGTGRTATAAQAQEVHAHIRQVLGRQWGASGADAVRIQYGGSVKPENAAELLKQHDIDGALVGGASLKAADFASIVNAA